MIISMTLMAIKTQSHNPVKPNVSAMIKSDVNFL